MCKNVKSLPEIAAILVLAGTLALGGCADEKAAPAVAAPTVSVIIVESGRQPLTSELSRRTTTYRIAEIRPRVSA
jgi:membrane fusion protein (multidrug efflux system)